MRISDSSHLRAAAVVTAALATRAPVAPVVTPQGFVRPINGGPR